VTTSLLHGPISLAKIFATKNVKKKNEIEKKKNNNKISSESYTQKTMEDVASRQNAIKAFGKCNSGRGSNEFQQLQPNQWNGIWWNSIEHGTASVEQTNKQKNNNQFKSRGDMRHFFVMCKFANCTTLSSEWILISSSSNRQLLSGENNGRRR